MTFAPAHRVVVGLCAAAPALRAPFPKARGQRGAKAAGLRFERAVRRQLIKQFPKAQSLPLPTLSHGPWYEFTDANGRGYCQPDFVIQTEREVFALECKLTDTVAGEAQLRELYLPVLRMAHGLPAYGIVLVRHLTPATDRSRLVPNLSTAIVVARSAIHTLHWLSVGPL